MTGVHRHHVDGRLGPGLAYVDGGLTVPLVPVDHRLIHLVLNDLGAEWPSADEAVLLHRVRRHAITCGWAADHDRTLTFDPHAARALQHLWLDVLDALEGLS